MELPRRVYGSISAGISRPWDGRMKIGELTCPGLYYLVCVGFEVPQASKRATVSGMGLPLSRSLVEISIAALRPWHEDCNGLMWGRKYMYVLAPCYSRSP